MFSVRKCQQPTQRGQTDLRMRRLGQDQQRAHRWNLDRIAIALQQGSVERSSFLKELDQNLIDQSEQLEEALSAPDDS